MFNPSHCTGHQCWHLHDPGHPDHDPDLAERLGDPVLRSYRAIDDELARVLPAAPPDVTTIVFGCLGMGPNFGAGRVLDKVLLALDPRRPSATLTPTGPTVRAWRRHVPLELRRGMPDLWHRTARRREASLLARRSWFYVDTGARTGGVRFNLAGREREGTVRPGPELETATAGLIEALHELVDDETGSPIVRWVERTAEHHHGPHAADLPDLFVHWEPAAGPARAVRSPRLGVVTSDPPDRTGHHHRDGFFVATGPGLPSGTVAGDARVVDLAPTVAALLGVELEGVDGHAIADLVGHASSPSG